MPMTPAVFDEGQVALDYYERGEENNTEVFYGLNGVYNYDGDVDDLIGVTVQGLAQGRRERAGQHQGLYDRGFQQG